jgi:hypothetical protein
MNVSTAIKFPVLLWTRREAAAALGVSERTLFDLTKETDIPRVRLSSSSFHPFVLDTAPRSNKSG